MSEVGPVDSQESMTQRRQQELIGWIVLVIITVIFFIVLADWYERSRVNLDVLYGPLQEPSGFAAAFSNPRSVLPLNATEDAIVPPTVGEFNRVSHSMKADDTEKRQVFAQYGGAGVVMVRIWEPGPDEIQRFHTAPNALVYCPQDYTSITVPHAQLQIPYAYAGCRNIGVQHAVTYASGNWLITLEYQSYSSSADTDIKTLIDFLESYPY